MNNNMIPFIKKHISIEHCVVRFLMAWCFVNLLKIIFIKVMKKPGFESITFVGYMGITVEILLIIFCFLCFYFLFELIKRNVLEKSLFFLISFVYSIVCVSFYTDLVFCIGIAVLMGLSVCYCFTDLDLSKAVISKKILIGCTVLFAGLFIIFTAACTVYKYLTFSSPNYDLGLFSQMFHYMKTTFTMNTTSERDQLLSHLCVHISPVFYLFLPFYALIPSPATLQFLQAAVLGLGVIPLYLICNNHKLSGIEKLFVIIAYCMYPVFSGGCFFDLHENCFLPLFLLLLIYFIEKDSWKGIIISMVLVFLIKEDAAIYVVFIALYMLFGRKMWKKGSVVLLSSILYFIFTTVLLSKIGDGVMSYRFNNMIYGQDSNMLGIIRTVIADPAYLVLQIFNKDKIEFLIQVLGPLVFLCCFTKKWPRFLLFGPLILFNLMSDYPYFHNVFFQYAFGSGTLLFYLAVINTADLKQKYRNRLFPLLAVVSTLFFLTIVWNKTSYIDKYYDAYEQKTIQTLNQGLSSIPKDASVTATTFLCPALSDRDQLYELYYTDKVTEYIALDLRVATTDYNVNTYLNQPQYQIVYYEQDKIAVFRNLAYTAE